MLNSLQIKNLALVEELEIDFSDGLNVVTGETGAGKSVILGAIKLLLGERADKSLIRTNEKAAEISAIIELGSTPALKKIADSILEEAGIIPDEGGQIILRRVVTASASKNYINSTPTTLNTMKSLGACFIDIYAPGEQQGLADNGKQRILLDRYASLKEDLKQTKALYQEWQTLIKKKEDFHKEIPDRGELEILRYQLKEIDDADIKENEDIEVKAEYNQCAGARELMDSTQMILSLLNGEEGSALNTLQQTVRQFHEMNSIDEEGTAPLTERAEAIIEEVYELSRDVDNYSNRLNLDPENLEFLEERLSTIQQLKKKYGPEITDIFAYRDKLADKINKADSFEELYETLLKDIDSAEKAFYESCKSLSAKRQKATDKLSKNISDQLSDLGFNGSYFEIKVEKSTPGPSGFDHIEFCFAPNKGEGSKPIKDIASSGEISRVMLAVKTVLAKIDQVPVLIFDEIDANIGGVVATKVANKLVELGKQHQIFCITHMPQVAAGGKIHFRVEKNVYKNRTFTEMKLLENEDRVEEIARMLGGSEISSVVKAHAKELLKSY
ncbi:MAG: DNA repair protein RecN [Lentisphaeraceae bacterium]|nr:DNA repair protein RecN [Lentisphaeraceae bacterium]